MSAESPSATAHSKLRHNWNRVEVAAIYLLPLPELVFQAQSLHRQFHEPDRVQTCQLIST
jgi:biotin synthase